MSVLEIRSTPTIRSLVKRGRGNLRDTIMVLGGEWVIDDKRTAEELAREIIHLMNPPGERKPYPTLDVVDRVLKRRA